MSGMTLTEFLLARIAEDEAGARAVSGSTVTGETPGPWTPVATGDEWEASLSGAGDLEVLVALRPGLPRPPDPMSGYWGAVANLTDEDAPRHKQDLALARYIARYDPARVLAECEAKRRIVELSWDHFGEDDYAWGMEEAKRQVLVLLALPYADHPAFQPEWAV